MQLSVDFVIFVIFGLEDYLITQLPRNFKNQNSDQIIEWDTGSVKLMLL